MFLKQIPGGLAAYRGSRRVRDDKRGSLPGLRMGTVTNTEKGVARCGLTFPRSASLLLRKAVPLKPYEANSRQGWQLGKTAH